MYEVEILKCATPFCDNIILEKDDEYIDKSLVFCPECRDSHSLPVLKLQIEHNKPIREIILDSSIFKTVNGMAAYVGVSFVTMYHWLDTYFGASFQEFRRTYICNSNNCYLLNIKRSSYSRNDYILKNIRSKRRYCACINALAEDHIMTNCPPDEVSKILRGYPNIIKVSDSLFSLAPKPAHLRQVSPRYLPNRPYPIKYVGIPRPINLKSASRPTPIHFFDR